MACFADRAGRACDQGWLSLSLVHLWGVCASFATFFCGIELGFSLATVRSNDEALVAFQPRIIESLENPTVEHHVRRAEIGADDESQQAEPVGSIAIVTEICMICMSLPKIVML
jgi:hypothetical protein